MAVTVDHAHQITAAIVAVLDGVSGGINRARDPASGIAFKLQVDAGTGDSGSHRTRSSYRCDRSHSTAGPSRIDSIGDSLRRRQRVTAAELLGRWVVRLSREPISSPNSLTNNVPPSHRQASRDSSVWRESRHGERERAERGADRAEIGGEREALAHSARQRHVDFRPLAKCRVDPEIFESRPGQARAEVDVAELQSPSRTRNRRRGRRVGRRRA